MANTINITFSAAAVVADHIEFKLNYYLDGSLNQVVRGNTFNVNRTYPGEAVIGTDANSQAQNYYEAFIADYGSSFIVSILDNVVTITSVGNDFISDFVTTGSEFATGEILIATPGTGSWFESPYPVDGMAFTLDPKYFVITTDATDSYFQFDSSIKIFEFFTNEVKFQVIPQKLVPFKGSSKINLGQLTHRLMSIFNEVNENLRQYQFAEVDITCSEISLSNNTVIRSFVNPTIFFIAGLSRGFNNYGFLEFNPKANRVTKNSFAYLNIYIPPGPFEMRIFKNGNLLDSEALPIDGVATLCKKVQFSDYAQGDRIDFVVDIIGQDNEDAPKKTFLMFPECNYSNMIVWENEFKLQSAIECTGSASLDADLEFQSQKKYQNLVETLEHLSSSKEVKLYMDTGWLLFTDTDTVESLMRSKRAWLIQGENKIALRPTGKKLPKQDYENELISYSLEFTINRKYDEETYTL